MTDLDITLRKLDRADYPQGNDWDKIQRLARKKFSKRHQDITVGEEVLPDPSH